MAISPLIRTYWEETARHGRKISWKLCRIPVRPFVYIVTAGQPRRLGRKRPILQGENNAETEGWRNRNQKLRTACCARCGVPSDGTGCHDTLSEHGTNRAVSDGPNCRDRASSQCCTQFDLRWRRSHGAGTGGIPDRGEGHEWFSLHRGAVLGAGH